MKQQRADYLWGKRVVGENQRRDEGREEEAVGGAFGTCVKLRTRLTRGCLQLDEYKQFPNYFTSKCERANPQLYKY